MNDIIFGIAIVPLIVGIVQVGKMSGFPDRFAPLLSLILGLGLEGVTTLGAAEIHAPEVVFTGIALGLSASGLYSGVKAVTST